LNQLLQTLKNSDLKGEGADENEITQIPPDFEQETGLRRNEHERSLDVIVRQNVGGAIAV
jgi:hypothetical protein